MRIPSDAPDGLRRLRTPRLGLRPVDSRDLAFLTALFGDPRVTAHRPDPTPDGAPAVAARLGRDIFAWRNLGFGRWLVSDRDGPVGVLGLSPRRDLGALNLSYHLAPAAQGRGYATEAAAAALRVAFLRLGAPLVVGLARPANPASQRVLLRLGFAAAGMIQHGGAPTGLFLCPASGMVTAAPAAEPDAAAEAPATRPGTLAPDPALP